MHYRKKQNLTEHNITLQNITAHWYEPVSGQKYRTAFTTNVYYSVGQNNTKLITTERGFIKLHW